MLSKQQTTGPERYNLAYRDFVLNQMMSIQILNKVVALWGMARPLILVSVMLVYFTGSLIARANGYGWSLLPFVWGLLALMFVALSIHYANEYADHLTDALTTRTPFSGGSGVLPAGLVSRRLALQAAWVTLIMGSIIAGMGVVIGMGNSRVLLVLLLGVLGGWMYSLPPLALAWRGWGEADNAVLGGILLPLYGYTVQTGRVDWQVIVGCLPFALLVFINLLATTWADREADFQVGKRTLATLLPIRQLWVLYGTAAVLSFAALPFLADRILPRSVALSSFAALPLVLWAGLHYTRIHSPHPTVFAMIALLLIQIVTWFLAGN